MFRSVGSIAFGIASDRYGRKWPFIVNNLLFIVLELVSTPSRPFCDFVVFCAEMGPLHDVPIDRDSRYSATFQCKALNEVPVIFVSPTLQTMALGRILTGLDCQV